MKKYKKYIFSIWITFLVVLISAPLYIYCVQYNLFKLFGKLPSSQILENPENELASELYSCDGILLGKYFRYNRSPIAFEQLSKNVINALLSTEDCRFQEHSGIDLKGLLRAFLLSIVLQKHKGGGSTITQQLAKNLFKTRADEYKGLFGKIPIIKTIIIKTKEWIVATKLERAYTKEEILSMYLNTVTFGSNTFGIKSAAKTFFNTEAENLTINQSAILIGLLKAPTKYSPITNPKNCFQRKNVILLQMLKKNLITKEEFKINSQKPLELNYKVDNHISGLAPYFRAIVVRYLIKWTKKHGYDLYNDGLKIYTTIDTKIQKHAEDAIAEHMSSLQEKFIEHWGLNNPWVGENGKEIENFIEKAAKKTELYKSLEKQYGDDIETINKIMNTPRMTKIFTWQGEIEVNMSPMEEIAYNKRLLRAGLIALDPTTGNIKAWVGGINFKHFKYDQVLQGKRQPGSAFKAILFAAAMDNGFKPEDEVMDIPITFSVPGGTWTPQNWHKKYKGEKMTLRQALSKSINSVSAYLIKKLGPELVVYYAKKLGITSHLDPVPALCLGISDVSLYELIGAYNVFANKGVWTKPMFITRIEDRHGNIIKEFNHKKKEAINEKTAYLMLYMLKGALEEEGGSAINLDKEIKKNNEIAAKSGTTQNQSDGWYIGLSPSLSVGVWVGGDERCIHFKDFKNGQSGKTAKPLWEKFMYKYCTDQNIEIKIRKFPKPNPNLKLDKYFKDKNDEIGKDEIKDVNTDNDDKVVEEKQNENIYELDIDDIY